MLPSQQNFNSQGGAASQVNPKKVYVGNLPYSVGEDQLRDLCQQFGEISSVKLITDFMTGRSKGFGFVEFMTEEAAAQCVQTLNGQDMDGRPLMVTIARPQQPRERGERGGGGGRSFGNNRGGGGNRSFGGGGRSDRPYRGDN